MNASIFTVKGDWRRASSSPDVDPAEAQEIVGIRLSTVPELNSTRALSPTRTPQAFTFDDLFGATHVSQHDSCPSLSDDVLPPPYVDEPPAYSVIPHAEPVTLAKHLFKFGFVFPPFWILGAIILTSPLTAPAEFEPDKSRAERKRLVQIIRDAEVRWAKRCVWALSALLILVGLAAAIAFAVWHS